MEDLEFKFYNIFWHLMRFCTRVNYFENMKPFADKTQFTEQNLLAKTTKLVCFSFLHARNFATNHTVCFFVSEWLIPLKCPHFSLYSCLILNGKKEVDISHVSSRSLILVYQYERQNSDAEKGRSTFFYNDIFYNTLVSSF